MNAAAVNSSADDGPPGRAGYRRSAGSPRGEARRRELLDRVHSEVAVPVPVEREKVRGELRRPGMREVELSAGTIEYEDSGATGRCLCCCTG